ncbi:rhodanese-like domain-containing protein [Pricia sp.]|uniref:rhodanese-like domain-containing protein n=1 Tax=Pricia sp. TaxID=2268138 RepID=UPI003593E26F
MKCCIVGLLLLVVSMGFAQITEKSITEFSRKDANTGILIDVRTPEEYVVGHVETAVNADWFAAIKFKAIYPRLPSNCSPARSHWCSYYGGT